LTTELYEFRRVDPPLPAPLIAELLRFWKTIFQGDFSGFDAMLAGKESQLNRHSVYLAEQRGKIAATCRMGISLSDPRLACLGEVATAPEHRGHNLTTRLCCQAVYDFDHADGQAFFLGTVNPVAAKIYTRLGWRYLAGTKVMLRTSSGLTPEEFMVDYFRQGLELPVKVAPGTTACRISMIPLILTPHDWVVLDAKPPSSRLVISPRSPAKDFSLAINISPARPHGSQPHDPMALSSDSPASRSAKPTSPMSMLSRTISIRKRSSPNSIAKPPPGPDPKTHPPSLPPRNGMIR